MGLFVIMNATYLYVSGVLDQNERFLSLNASLRHSRITLVFVLFCIRPLALQDFFLLKEFGQTDGAKCQL